MKTIVEEYLEKSKSATKFGIVEKDHKSTWSDDFCSSRINWMEHQGMNYSIEISGMEFGIDSDYLVCSSSLLEQDVAIQLIQFIIFDLAFLEEEEQTEEWKVELKERDLVLSEYLLKEDKEKKVEQIIFSLDDENYVCEYPTTSYQTNKKEEV